jgi:hypothetical protein
MLAAAEETPTPGDFRPQMTSSDLQLTNARNETPDAGDGWRTDLEEMDVLSESGGSLTLNGTDEDLLNDD